MSLGVKVVSAMCGGGRGVEGGVPRPTAGMETPLLRVKVLSVILAVAMVSLRYRLGGGCEGFGSDESGRPETGDRARRQESRKFMGDRLLLLFSV